MLCTAMAPLSAIPHYTTLAFLLIPAMTCSYLPCIYSSHVILLSLFRPLILLLPQICLAYALHLGLAVVPKSSNKQHLTENFNAQEVQLDSEDMDQLRDLDQNNLKLFEFGFFLSPGQTLESLWDLAEDEAFVLD